MRPKTAASVAVLTLMLGTGAAMAQTTPSPSTNGVPPSTQQNKSPPAAQMPPEKMPAEKVMPSPNEAVHVDGAITAQATNTVLGTDLIGKTAYGADQKKIGTINDIVMKQDGSGIEGVVVGIGGFLGLGEHSVALKMDKFSFRPSESGRILVVLNATREELEKAPAFKSKVDQEAEAARNAQRPTPPSSGSKAPSR